jgi:DNA replication protein DnaC
LEEFSFDAYPAINPAVIAQLASCAWVKAGHPLCLIGDSGVGKAQIDASAGTLADSPRRRGLLHQKPAAC